MKQRCLGQGCTGFATAGGLCEDCWDRRRALLGDIPEMWQRLHAELVKGSPGESEGGARAKPGSKPPLVVAVLDLLAAVPRRLTGWADACLRADGRDMMSPMMGKGVRWGRQLTDAVGHLERLDHHLRAAEASVLAARYLATLVALHEQMARLLGHVERVQRLDAPCQSCGQRTLPLYLDTARKTVSCTACGEVTPHGHWVGHVLFSAVSKESQGVTS